MYGLKIKVHRLFILPRFFVVVEDLKMIWKNFKENLSKCIKKRDLMTRSGGAASSLPECKLFHQLQFLRDKVTNRPTVSNLPQESAPTQEILGKSLASPVSPVPFAPSPASSLESMSTIPGKRKRKATTLPQRKLLISDDEHPDKLLYEALKGDNRMEVIADQSFPNSIVPILRNLPPRKNRQAKIEIQQLLLKYEFDDDEF